MQISNADTAAEDPVLGMNPILFWGPDEATANGANPPFVTAPVGSLYVRKTATYAYLYLKQTDNGADADWVEVLTT